MRALLRLALLAALLSACAAEVQAPGYRECLSGSGERRLRGGSRRFYMRPRRPPATALVTLCRLAAQLVDRSPAPSHTRSLPY